jgi:tetratricopeptide (TPR) repeat protein
MPETPKLYLNMIVKNESRVILRLLESVYKLIDGYCICDTGSTDNTIELIEEFFKKHNIPGQIVREPFRDFGYNRTFALNACLTIPGLTSNDYLLLLDADMVLTGNLLSNPEEFKKNLTNDVYLLLQGSDQLHYKNARIIKNKGYTYWGVTHEYLNTNNNATYTLIEKHQLFIQDIGDGGAKTDKSERDIRLLLKGLEDNPNSDRYVFYLANTYRDTGKYEEALGYYKKRIELGGWIEEVWQSYYSGGRCYYNMKDIPNAINMWLEGYEAYPNRIENLYQIITHYRNIGKSKLAYQYYRMAKHSTKIYGGAKDDFLFLEKNIYDYKLDYEFTIIGYYENPDKLDLKRISMNVISCPIIEDIVAKNILSNYKFYVDKISSKTTSILNEKLMELLYSRELSIEEFYPSTPSICFLNTSIIAVNKRYVNYCIDEKGNYINKEIIQTINILSIIDIQKMEKIQESVLNYDTSLDNIYVGLEDIRLYSREDKLYYNANRGLSPLKMQIEYGEIDISCSSTKNNVILQRVEKEKREIEKNWVLFTSGSNKTRCIYEWSPLTIGEIDGENFKTIVEYSNVPYFFNYIRGSTNGVTIGNEVWFICHLVSYESRRYYYHIVVVLDKVTGKLKKHTNLFLFEREMVEYTLGFLEIGENLVIGYSILDKETKFIEISKAWFEGQMMLA